MSTHFRCCLGPASRCSPWLYTMPRMSLEVSQSWRCTSFVSIILRYRWCCAIRRHPGNLSPRWRSRSPQLRPKRAALRPQPRTPSSLKGGCELLRFSVSSSSQEVMDREVDALISRRSGPYENEFVHVDEKRRTTYWLARANDTSSKQF